MSAYVVIPVCLVVIVVGGTLLGWVIGALVWKWVGAG
jgi:hypothetical protein